jgi:hypothetical protein
MRGFFVDWAYLCAAKMPSGYAVSRSGRIDRALKSFWRASQQSLLNDALGLEEAPSSASIRAL